MTATMTAPNPTIDEQIAELQASIANTPVTKTCFIISSKILHKHIKSLLSAVSSNPIVPILENILFSVDSDELLTLRASDLQTNICCELPVEVRGIKPTTKPVQFCINARRLYKLLSKLPEQPISLAFDGDSKVTICPDSGYYNFFSENPLDYPKLPTLSEPARFTMAGKVLVDALIKTLPFTCGDDLRPAMTGVYFEGSNMAATDGHRLIRVQVDGLNTYVSFILPYKAGSVFLKAYGKSDDNVHCEVVKNNMRLAWANYTLIVRLIDERFPDYQNAIPTNNSMSAVINRQALIRLVSRTLDFANRFTHLVAFTFSKGKITVEAEDLDSSEDCTESMAVKYDDYTFQIGFNGLLMADLLKHVPGSHIQIEMSAPNRACVIYPCDGEPDKKHLSLLMPVMLNTYA
ncbi:MULTISPECIES: DNA polymerase III subunit beta [unclassified Spirosoma]|uniref:DNA polymerase III subunit beta n=1 Tax=unclassified Spirosoma TaxID=2621999 RepID=UPI001AD043BA|nr:MULTISPECIES: DNA polymerase III subunit beta [unclassified Spirosoma]MBN8824421.1 DNA polymerase III subunit beta [Spirosoma sp.]